MRQQIVLVEDYELGLVHRGLDGLDELHALTMPQPSDVDAAQVTLRWSAQRPTWSLTLRRNRCCQPVAATASLP